MRISAVVVPVVTLFSFTLALAQFNLPVLIPGLEDELGITSAQSGMLMSIFVVSYVALQVPLGLLADRVGGLRVVAASGLLLAAVSVLGGLAGSYEALLAVRLGVGLGTSACFPVCSGLITRHLPPRRSAAAFGAFGLGLPLGSIVAMLLLPGLVGAAGWRAGLLSCAPFAIALAALALWASRSESAPVERAPLAEVAARLGAIARSRGFWALVTINFVSAGVYVGVVTWLPSFLVDAHGLGLGAAGGLTAAVVALGIFSSPAGGLVSGRVGRQRVILLTSAALLALCLGLAVPGPLALAAACALGLGWFLYFHFGAYFSLATQLVARAGGGQASASIGFYNCIGYAGTLVPPLLTGALLDATGSYQTGFAPLAVIAAVGVVVALYLQRVR